MEMNMTELNEIREHQQAAQRALKHAIRLAARSATGSDDDVDLANGFRRLSNIANNADLAAFPGYADDLHRILWTAELEAYWADPRDLDDSGEPPARSTAQGVREYQQTAYRELKRAMQLAEAEGITIEDDWAEDILDGFLKLTEMASLASIAMIPASHELDLETEIAELDAFWAEPADLRELDYEDEDFEEDEDEDYNPDDI